MAGDDRHEVAVPARAAATPPATPVARFATAARPLLRLARRTAPVPGAEAERAGLPAAAGSTVAHLARATGGEVFDESSGLATVEFPTPGSAGVVARATVPTSSGAPPTESIAEAAPAVAPAAAPSAPAPPATRTGADMDEVYEHVVRRLRRDLLLEREAMGDLTGDIF
jgi:hypothetical protein